MKMENIWSRLKIQKVEYIINIKKQFLCKQGWLNSKLYSKKNKFEMILHSIRTYPFKYLCVYIWVGVRMHIVI